VTKEGKHKVKVIWWWNENVQKSVMEKKECISHMHVDWSTDNRNQYKVAKKTTKRLRVSEARHEGMGGHL
jgi:hypothetical protein